jgi:hypothetical protein
VTQQEFFEHVLSVLERLQIPYMVAGSVGAMLYGEPRLTNDMDVVIELLPGRATALVEAFSADEFYVPPVEAVRDAIARRGQFNVIHMGSGAKVDFVVRKETDFAREEFFRRRRVVFSKRMQCHSASPEDIIIAKMLAYREGRSEKHIADIRGIISVSGQALDWGYLMAWVRKLGLAAHWRAARLPDGPES